MNEQFLTRMQDYLKEEYPAYLASLEEPCYRGLRVNTSKLTIEAFLALNICKLRPSSICPQSFYIEEAVQGLGNHPAHLAGLCYMQEPSASSAVEVLDVQKGDWVLDMCAAPGGKSTQIAAKLDHTGFLVSNEIEGKRAQILLSNMERLGFSQCMVTNNKPNEIAKHMKGWFDRVLVDAPCSGEGMFKKHSKAMEDWSIEHVRSCAKRQLLILADAYEALKQDGILVYSTCTYAMEENEQVIYEFLQTHPDMELVDASVSFGRKGLPYKDLAVEKLVRIFPMDEGEGHFVAKLKKHGEQRRAKIKEKKTEVLPGYVQQFFQEQLGFVPSYIQLVQDRAYAKTTSFVETGKLRVLRQGLYCGDMIKNRFEPHQHFYMSGCYQQDFQQYVDVDEAQCQAFLQGHPLAIPGYRGYTQIRWHGYGIGFAKGDGQVLKNKYPKGLRIHG